MQAKEGKRKEEEGRRENGERGGQAKRKAERRDGGARDMGLLLEAKATDARFINEYVNRDLPRAHRTCA